MSNWPASYRSFLMATALCLLTPIPRNGCSNAQPNEDNVVFHFLGDNQLQGGLYPVLCCQYDLTLVCHLEQDMAGFQWYSIQSVDFIIDFRYSLDYWGPFPPEMMPPPSEHVRLCFGSDDFNLAFNVSASCEGSHLSYSHEGAPANPFEADFYDACLPLISCREFHTPLGAQIVYDAGTEFRFGTTDLEGHPIGGVFYGHLVIPPPWAAYSLDFALLRLQATPAHIRYLDAENIRREVTGAVADGRSRVIVEVDGTHSQPSATLPENGGEWIEEEWEEVDDSVWCRTWQAPEDFCVDDEDFHHVDSRVIDFQFRIDGTTVPGPPFYLYKPPVLLLHGAFGATKDWNRMKGRLIREYFGGNRLLVHAPSYDNDVHFDRNISTIAQEVGRTLLMATKDSGSGQYGEIVAKKVDIVAHSMGGILAGLYVASAEYRHDVNRIITIDTPHSGSQQANAMMHFLYSEMTSLQRWSFLCTNWLRELSEQFTHGKIDSGAVEDLQVQSRAILEYRSRIMSAPSVPVFAICGFHNGPRPDYRTDGVYFVLWLWDCDLAAHSHFEGSGPGRKLMYSVDPDGPSRVEAGLFGQGITDFVVPLVSQEGGLPREYVRRHGIVDHVVAPQDAQVIDSVLQLLSAPINQFAPRFQPTYIFPGDDWTVETPPEERLCDDAGLSEESTGLLKHVTSSHVAVSYPNDGTIFRPGDSISVLVDCNIPLANGMILQASCCGISVDDTLPWEFRIAIDSTCIGPMTIMVLGLDEGVGWPDSLTDWVTVNIVPLGEPQEIDIVNCRNLWLYPGENYTIGVMALYPDSVWREIISSVTGTQYSSSNPNVATVSQDGAIHSVLPGETMINVTNGATARLQVFVIGAPQNLCCPNPPDNATGVVLYANLDWGSEFASWYDLYLWKAGSDRPQIPVAAQLAESFYDNPDTLIPATTYRWQVVAKNAAGETQSPVWTFTTAGGIEGESKIAVSPNPFVPSRGHAVLSFFGEGLPYTSIRVFNKAGELVRSLEETLGQPRLDWDATSESGNKLASGVYIWVSKSRDGKYTRGKFAIIR